MSPPFVMDVFALDAITEMLNSPLQLLSYIDRRTGYTEKLMASHELTILYTTKLGERSIRRLVTPNALGR